MAIRFFAGCQVAYMNSMLNLSMVLKIKNDWHISVSFIYVYCWSSGCYKNYCLLPRLVQLFSLCSSFTKDIIFSNEINSGNLEYWLLALHSMLLVTLVNLMKMTDRQTDHRYAIFQKPVSITSFVPSSFL